jgi:hypothetical protein
LQILGLYNSRQSNVFKILKELRNAQLFLPIIVINVSNGYKTFITIYPAFYSVDPHAAIPQVLAQSICKDQGNFLVSKTEHIIELSVFLVDSSDIPSIYALAKDMAVSFPRFYRLDLFFERRCEIVSFLLTVNHYNRA